MSEVTIHVGDCIEQMRNIPDESVDTVITSPPYWGLRDYGGGGKVWGNHLCIRDDDTYVNHEWEGYTRPSENTRKNNNSLQLKSAYWEPQEQAFCKHCDAWFGQLGLEPTPEQYVKNMVKVFDEVKRILKPEGTLWLNLGDSYCAGTRKTGKGDSMHDGDLRGKSGLRNQASGHLKNKDLVGIPWRVAFALQEAGWWLRQDIIWAKPNCMPESVKDRCTKNHEYMFLLTKSQNYYFDHEAIKEPVTGSSKPDKKAYAFKYGDDDSWAKDGDISRKSKATGIAEARTKEYTTRNKRSVWWVGPKPFPEAHFAVFPIELIEPCVLAGTSEHGCCSECGASWKRVVKRRGTEQDSTLQQFKGMEIKHANPKRGGQRANANGTVPSYIPSSYDTKGWEPTCDCDTTDTIPAVVFDPFGGAGTTAIAAIKHGRNAILTELSPDYVKIAEKRISDFKKQTGLDDKGVEWL